MSERPHTDCDGEAFAVRWVEWARRRQARVIGGWSRSDYRGCGVAVRPMALATAVLGAVWGLFGGMEDCQAAAPRTVVRLGVGRGMWGGIKETDASAAIQAWTQAVLGAGSERARVETRVLSDVTELAEALENGQVDAVSVQTQWFLALPEALQPREVFVAGKGGSITERYVIVAHRASGLTNLAGLRGRQLLLHEGARTSLAESWLGTVLRGSAGLGAGHRPAVELTRTPSASRTVLGVFFRRHDAGLVTAEALETAGELNPQLQRDLRVLAESPEVVPNVFFFREGYVAAEKSLLMAAMCGLHERPEGQQLLAVFQCDQMQRRSVSCLDSSRLLLADQGQLAGLKQGTKTRPVSVP